MPPLGNFWRKKKEREEGERGREGRKKGEGKKKKKGKEKKKKKGKEKIHYNYASLKEFINFMTLGQGVGGGSVFFSSKGLMG